MGSYRRRDREDQAPTIKLAVPKDASCNERTAEEANEEVPQNASAKPEEKVSRSGGAALTTTEPIHDDVNTSSPSNNDFKVGDEVEAKTRGGWEAATITAT